MIQDLPISESDNRRVLAVLRYLSRSVRRDDHGGVSPPRWAAATTLGTTILHASRTISRISVSSIAPNTR